MPGVDFVQSYARPGVTTLFVWADEAIHGQLIERVWYQARRAVRPWTVREALTWTALGA